MTKPTVLLAIRPTQDRRDYSSALRRIGFEVRVADHGLDCLEVLEDFIPDVAVIEPELPWGGGDGVLSIMNSNQDLRIVPVVVLTADGNRSALYSISRYLIKDFLKQPVSAARLAERVRRLVPVQERLTTGYWSHEVCTSVGVAVT